MVDRINREITKIIRLKDMENRLHANGVAPVGSTPEQLFELIRKEIDQWRKVVAQAAIKIQ